MSKRKTEQGAGSKKKAKSALDSLAGQLDAEHSALKPNNGRQRVARPPGVESFSDDEADLDSGIGKGFLQATKMLDKLSKSNKEQEKRKKNVQKMQLDAVSDNEEDEEAAEQMAANAQRQAQALQAEDGDPEPEVLQQVLYPRQAPDVQETDVADVSELLQGCREQLQVLAPAALANADLMGSLLINGWLQRFCLINLSTKCCRSGRPYSNALVSSLFQLLAHSKSLRVATAAFKALMALMADTRQWEALTGCVTHLPTESSLYTCPAPAPTLEAVPTEKYFLEALHALGVSQDAAAGKSKAQKANAAAAPATESSLVKGTLFRLQLLLRTFAAVCRYQHKQGGGQKPFEGSGLQELLLTFLRLRLDPIGQLLAVELHAAIESALEAFDERDWGRCFSSLSSRVPSVGPTHRAHLAALKLLPAHTTRGFALQQAGAASLMRGLLKTSSQGSSSKGLPARRSAESALVPEEVVMDCLWFQGGASAVAREAKRDKGKPSFSLWEVETCIRAADLLLWPHIKKAKETGTGGLNKDFKREWHQFCGTLQKALAGTPGVASKDLQLHLVVMHAWDNQTAVIG